MTILNTPNDSWQIVIDNRLQGWQVQVSFWDGEDFETRFDAYMICESLFEAITSALDASGMEWEEIELNADRWGIYAPDEE